MSKAGIISGEILNVTISDIYTQDIAVIHGSKGDVKISDSGLPSIQIIGDETIQFDSVNGDNDNIFIQSQDSKIEIHNQPDQDIDIFDQGVLFYHPTGEYLPSVKAYLENENDLTGIVVGTYTVFHSGNSNKSDVNWTMNNANIYGDIEFRGEISTPSFVSGFNGSGVALQEDSGVYTLTVDNLVVRRGMTAYELIINQIRGTNGSLWVTDTAEIDSVTDLGTTWRCNIDTDGGDIAMPFQAGDVVRCQKWNGANVKYYSADVTSVGTGYFILDIIDGSDAPEAGDVVVRIGSSTDSDRQGSIYLTASDTGAPYIDVLDGVTDESLSGHTYARIGDLSGISDVDLGSLSGYGIYTQNGYFKGKLVVTAGSSGYSNLDDIPTELSDINSTEGSKLSGIEDGAQVNVSIPTIGIKINTISWDTSSNGNAYIHGFDTSGTPSDSDGFFYYNGSKITVDRDGISGTHTITTSQYGQGYIVYKSGDVYFCKKENGTWSYDSGSAWTELTTADSDLVIGTMVCDTEGIITSANVWGYAYDLDVVSEAAADNTTTVIDGGIITSGRIMLGSEEGATNVNSGINGYGTSGTNTRFWAGAPWDKAEIQEAPFYVLHNGEMHAAKGDIGGWDIKDNILESETASGKIEIDSGDLMFNIYDDVGVLRVKFHYDDIPGIDEMGAGSDGTYDGTDASTYSEITLTLTSNGDSDNSTYYLAYVNSSSGKSLDQDATDPGSSYYIKGYNDGTSTRVNLDGGNYYNISLKIRRNTGDYTLASNASLDPSPTLYQTDYESVVSLEGTFEYSYNVKLFASDGTELASQQVFSGSRDASDLDSTEILTAFNKNVFIPSGITSIYFTITYTVDNYAYQKEVRDYYMWDGGQWNTIFPHTTEHNSNISIDYNFDINELVFDTNYERTEIGADGIISYWSDSKYFSINDSNANSASEPFIESAGYWGHAGNLVLDGVIEELAQVKKLSNHSTNYDITNEDEVITNEGASGNIYFYLPATSELGKVFYIVNTSSGDNIYIRAKSGTLYLRGGGNSHTITTSTSYTLPASSSIQLIAITSARYALIE